MYESFFGFVNRPFLPAPTLDRYFPIPPMEQTIHTATRAIARAEGPVCIFGGTGLGKTVCCLRIAEHFRRSFEVVMLASSHLVTRRALLQSLLFELRMPFRDLNEGELRLTLMNRLQPSPELQSEGLLLIVDEAQTLSLKLLEEIRLLTNIMRNGLPRVRLVLCGNLKLEDNLCHPQMESLNQRIATRCYLTPLSMEETAHYVMHKIELSGVSHSNVITRDALEALYRGSDGIPRLIDRLADQSLLLAAQERQRPVSAALVGKAWGMLQQLPNPWSEPESIKSPAKSPSFVSQSTTASQSTTSSQNAATESQSIVVSQQATTHRPATVSPLPAIERPTTIGQSVSISTSIPTSTAGATANIAAWFQSSTIQASTSPASLAFGTESSNVIHDSAAIRYDASRQIDTSKNVAPASRSESIVEFGTLDEVCETTPSMEPSNGTKAKSFSLFSTAQPQPTIDRNSVFGGDFDEEFNLPVQSSNGYKSYSGVAFGNLNHDLQAFEGEPVNRFELGEADDFLVPTQSHFREVDQRREESFPADNMSFEPISNITPSQAANLERQVEEEMRELVSDLNMNAMTFDPMQTIVDAPSTTPAPMLLERFGERDVLSFAEMNQQWNPNERRERSTRKVTNAGDDRDMLVVEDDLETIRDTMGSVQNAPHRPVLHPYAKLFSNLRDS